MPVQGGNAINHNALYAGMVTSMQLTNGVSKLNKSSATIAFGLGVVSDGDDGMALPTNAATALTFIGVVKYELNRAYQDGETFGARADYDATVVTEGEVAVLPIVDVAKDNPVYLVIGNGTTPNPNLGRFSNIVGTGLNTGVLIPNAKWTTTTTVASAQPGKISLGIGG